MTGGASHCCLRVTAVFENGINHLIYCVDDKAVLKVPRPGENPLYLEREAQILQTLLRAESFPTTGFIGFEFGRHVQHPHIYMRRVEGVALEELPKLEGALRARVLRELAKALANLHRLPAAAFLAGPTFDLPAYLASRWERGMHALRNQSLLPPEDGRRLHTIFDREFASLETQDRDVLLHYDIRPDHVFVEPETGRLTEIIDFAGAQLGPPEHEFFVMWRRWWQHREDVETVFQHYEREMKTGPEFRAAVQFTRLVSAVDRVTHGNPDIAARALSEVQTLLQGF